MSRRPRVLALDNALTVTGWCTDGAPGVYKADRDRDARLFDYEDWLGGVIADHQPDVAVIEGYSHASRHQAHQLGELGWACRRTLAIMLVPYAIVAPGKRAKYATGKGSAGKAEVLAAAIRRLGYEGHDHNEADALWLHAMAVDHYSGERLVPAAHAAAADGIEWPDLEGKL